MEPAEPDSSRLRRLGASEATSRLDELAAILVDAVASGASVNFMAGFDLEGGRAFWRGQIPGIAAGERLLFVAEQGDRLVGTVVLSLAQQPNQPHRAEIGKMLVHSSMRRRGLGRRLLDTAEGAARELGRHLLILDTEAGSAGDRLYRSCGWTELGTVPGYALTPDGVPAGATIFYKQLR